jgi:hypothetical protein
VRPRTPSDIEATEIGHPHVAIAITVVTTDVAAKTMSTAMTGDVTTTRRRITARSATCLPRRRQATPTVRSARQEVDQHDRQRPEVQHEQEEVPEGQS